MSNDKKQIQVSNSVAAKLDLLKADWWLKKRNKPNNDTVLDYLLDQEIKKLGLDPSNPKSE